MVEQRTENPCVGGSIPPLGTSHKTGLFVIAVFCLMIDKTHGNVKILFPINVCSLQPPTGRKTNDIKKVC